MNVVGLDLSINGPGFCILKDGWFDVYGYITTTGKYCFATDKYGHQFRSRGSATKKHSAEDKDCFAARRRSFISEKVIAFIKAAWCPDLIVVMENYAYGSKSTGQYELGEISGIIRAYLWENEIPLRLIDPVTVKQWATGNAYAKKIHMRYGAERDAFTLPDEYFNLKGEKFKQKIVVEDNDGNEHILTHDLKGPGTDIIDAYHLARMGWYEYLVRSKQTIVDDLTSAHKHCLIKTTPTQPLGILHRPYIQIPELAR